MSKYKKMHFITFILLILLLCQIIFTQNVTPEEKKHEPEKAEDTNYKQDTEFLNAFIPWDLERRKAQYTNDYSYAVIPIYFIIP